MSIEFIRDEFLEGKKEELENIDKELSQKRKPTDRKVLFLRRFTLALMGQYQIKQKHFYKKNEEIEMLNRHLQTEINNIGGIRRPIQRVMPPAPDIPRPAGIPIPRPTLSLNIPSPVKENLKIPNPIPMESIPEKKEIKIPNPIQ